MIEISIWFKDKSNLISIGFAFSVADVENFVLSIKTFLTVWLIEVGINKRKLCLIIKIRVIQDDKYIYIFNMHGW